MCVWERETREGRRVKGHEKLSTQNNKYQIKGLSLAEGIILEGPVRRKIIGKEVINDLSLSGSS